MAYSNIFSQLISAAALSAGTFALGITPGPYVAGATLQISPNGIYGPYTMSVLGPGDTVGATYIAPAVTQPTQSTVIAASKDAFALQTIALVPPPSPAQAVVAVATYFGGVALHRADDFKLIGLLPVGEPIAGIAMSHNGDIFTAATDGTTLTTVHRSPWHVSRTSGVSVGNEVLWDVQTRAVFVSNRGVGDRGGLTRIDALGNVQTIVTGKTAEGLALDSSGHLYVSDPNDATITEIDARAMRILRVLPAPARAFGIALNTRKHQMYIVSNQNHEMRAAGGFVQILDLQSGRLGARSANMPFPIGVAYDAKSDRAIVTDEDMDSAVVLDPSTLAVQRKLHACNTPWLPHIEARSRRLFVPCARADRVAVFNLNTWRQVAHSPFSTGGYPLSVATP